MCPEPADIDDVEQAVGVPVLRIEWEPAARACHFSVGEPATDVVTVHVGGYRPPTGADLAALRQIDLDRIPIQDSGEPPADASAITQEYDLEGRPAGAALRVDTGPVEIRISYSTLPGQERPLRADDLRPQLIALARRVIDRL